jgi:hypothetical protein
MIRAGASLSLTKMEAVEAAEIPTRSRRTSRGICLTISQTESLFKPLASPEDRACDSYPLSKLFTPPEAFLEK